jgi:hypothetical protein
MLETRKPPASPRIRPADVSRRPITSPSRTSGNAVLRAETERSQTERSRVDRRQSDRRQADTARRPASAVRPNRLGRSEMRLMGLASACTAMVCGLLLLYLAAYAHVTRLGIDQANARVQLRRNLMQNEMLQAERDSLQSPHRVAAAALALGMTERGSVPIEYLSPTASLPEIKSEVPEVKSEHDGGAARFASFGGGADQGTYGGTTADGSTAASLHH